jgi:hypothetical protein
VYLNKSEEMASGEMITIRTPGFHISQLIETARNSVSGKSIQEALSVFVGLYHGADVEKLRNCVLERRNKFFFRSFFASTKMSRDGRTIAKSPALGHGEEITEDTENAIHTEMIRDHIINIGIVVKGNILPALEILILEHRLREADFIGLAYQSPIVPKDRAGLFGKALFCGYDCDFIAALHLLIPQIENMVREHLKQAGAITTTLDENGIQKENGMSALMKLPEAEQVFGKNLTFELKALFCDPFGPNLRNEIAHGLLDESDCSSQYAIYAWWLALKLVFNNWWNAARKEAEE